MDILVVKSIVYAVTLIVAVVALAVICNRWEKEIDANDNLKDVEK